MAVQATVKKTAETVRKAAGPRASRAKPARVFDYARFKVAIHDEDEFARYLAGYPDKSGLMAYVYRLVPRIDVTLVGVKETNILETDLLVQMTHAYVVGKFGRGKYLLKLTDANRPKGESEVCRTWFKAEDDERPPVYDIRTLLLGHPDNIDEVNRLLALGHLVREPSGAPRIRHEGDSAPASFTAGAAGTGSGVGDLLSRDTLGAVLLKLVDRGSQNPADTVRQSIEIAKLLAPAGGGGSSLSPDQIADLVMARMALASPARSAPPVDVFDAYERVEGFITRVRGGGGAVAADGAAGWAASVPGILQGLTALVPTIISGVERLRAAPVAVAAPPRVQNGHVAQPKPIIERIAEVAAIGMQRMDEGVNGLDYAAWVCAWYDGGLEVYRFLEPQGVAGVIGLMAMNPQSAPLLKDAVKRPQIESFLADFFTYDSAGGAEETETELPAA